MTGRRILFHTLLSCSFILALVAPSVQLTVSAQESDRSLRVMVTDGHSAQHQAQGHSEIKEVIVKFKREAGGVSATLHRSLGAGLVSHGETGRFDIVAVPDGMTAHELIDRYLETGLVEYAEPNYPRFATWAPNDPFYAFQWHFDQVNAEAAWDIQQGGASDIVVAVLDTGIAYENYDVYYQAPDLAGTTFVPGYDFINDDVHANDDHGHGTHVTGTIAQTTNNARGVAGLAFNVSIMPVKVLGSDGSGTVGTIVDGINFAIANGASVINLSLGGPGYTQSEAEAIAAAYAAGVVVVAAAGNEYENGNAAQYPAAFATPIAVGATRYDKTRAPYSNTGDYLDIAAPGGDLSSDQNEDGYPDGVLQQTFTGVGHFSSFGLMLAEGTSMAAPHVSAAVALLLSQNPELTPHQVSSILESTAIDLGTEGWDEEFGHGLLDLAASLLMANPSPNIAVSPGSLRFTLPAGVTYEDNLTLSNEGNSTLSYSIMARETVADAAETGCNVCLRATPLSTVSWLDVSPTSGTVAPGNSTQLSVSIDTAGLPIGQYSADIVVASNDPDNSEIIVPVILTVTTGVPTVATVSISDIGAESANGYGTISDVGLEPAAVVGFCWNTDPNPLPSHHKAESSETHGIGDFGPIAIEPLVPGTTYYARAYARNTVGCGYGEDVVFTTLPSAPSQFTATADGPYCISLNWTPGEGAGWTHIRVKDTAWEVEDDRSDGEEVYDGNGTSWSYGPLQPNTPCYFRAWSRTLDHEDQDLWSTAYDQDSATTSSGDALVTEFVLPLHAGWNMVSVPLDLLGFNKPAQVFPDALAVYRWNPDGRSYSEPGDIEPGCGYWVAMAQADEDFKMKGIPVLVESRQLTLSAGWNLFGSMRHETNVKVTDLQTTPSEPDPLQRDHVYYWNGTSYEIAEYLEPGKAYWLAASVACEVTVGS